MSGSSHKDTSTHKNGHGCVLEGVTDEPSPVGGLLDVLSPWDWGLGGMFVAFGLG
jgi:hypothetical protein